MSVGTVVDTRWVYTFGGGRADGDASMKNLLGGKGANLAEMSSLGLPVPPGFTVTTEACNAYLAAGEQFPAGLWEALEQRSRETGEPVRHLVATALADFLDVDRYPTITFRSTSIRATSAFTGTPSSRAAFSSACQNIGSRLIDVSWPAIVTDRFTGP